MTYLADAHRDWHTVHGRYAVCPLDCGAIDPIVAAWEEDQDRIAEGEPSFRCGHCKGRHTSVFIAKECAKA